MTNIFEKKRERKLCSILLINMTSNFFIHNMNDTYPDIVPGIITTGSVCGCDGSNVGESNDASEPNNKTNYGVNT